MARNEPQRLLRSEYQLTRYFHIAAPGVSLEQVMASTYWVHVRNQFRANDIVEVRAADGAYDAEIRLLSITADGNMKFCVLHYWQEQVAASRQPVAPIKMASVDHYTIHHKGFAKYELIEKETGIIVADGLDKATAEEQKTKLEAARAAA